MIYTCFSTPPAPTDVTVCKVVASQIWLQQPESWQERQKAGRSGEDGDRTASDGAVTVPGARHGCLPQGLLVRCLGGLAGTAAWVSEAWFLEPGV